ncbi:MAG TPA: hypothetical protein VJG32_08835 [Anaerolineae bacterium]|nr:hypothetical protein [Anaerolineae bacterium]
MRIEVLPGAALHLFAAANALREQGGTPMTPDEHIYFDEQLKGLREKMDSLKFDSIWSQGRASPRSARIDARADAGLEQQKAQVVTARSIVGVNCPAVVVNQKSKSPATTLFTKK